MRREFASGLDHTLYRQYAWNLGRWLSPDPEGCGVDNPQALNRYVYVVYNPSNLVDPLGLQGCRPGAPNHENDCQPQGGSEEEWGFSNWAGGGGGGGHVAPLLDTGPEVGGRGGGAAPTRFAQARAVLQDAAETLASRSEQESQLRADIRRLSDEFEGARQTVSSFDERLASIAKLAGMNKLASAEQIGSLLAKTRKHSQIAKGWSERVAQLQSRRSMLSQTPLLRRKRREAEKDSKAKAQLGEERLRLHNAVQILSRAREVARDSQVASIGKILEGYSPLIKEIYARLHPHKVFTEFDMQVFPAYKEGELFLQALTPDGIVARIQPYFSMTQRNAVAFCVFLALNLSLGGKPRTIFIDDPVHSMDDINILVLADLLNALAVHRQLVVSTHDRRVFDLFTDKVRPEGSVDGVISYWFESWGRSGPQILRVIPPARSEPLPIEQIVSRLAASA